MEQESTCFVAIYFQIAQYGFKIGDIKFSKMTENCLSFRRLTIKITVKFVNKVVRLFFATLVQELTILFV